MYYVSGLFALNMPCSLNTTGDWHSTCLDWRNMDWRDSTGSLFLSYGIEKGITQIGEKVYHANHIRAVLDLLEKEQFGLAQQANIWIDNCYWEKLFVRVEQFQKTEKWDGINHFMAKEFRTAWLQRRRAEQT